MKFRDKMIEYFDNIPEGTVVRSYSLLITTTHQMYLISQNLTLI